MRTLLIVLIILLLTSAFKRIDSSMYSPYKVKITLSDEKKTVFEFLLRQNYILKNGNFKYNSEENKIFITGKIIDPKGKLEFQLIDSLNKSIISGKFSNGLEMLKEQVTEFDVEGNGKVIVRKYIEPIADGEWIIKDFNSKIQSKRTYIKGILIIN